MRALATRTTLTLTDPRAIRAIAHEARQLVIDELYGGSVITATEAAQICGPLTVQVDRSTRPAMGSRFRAAANRSTYTPSSSGHS
jgi:hypothetical protein